MLSTLRALVDWLGQTQLSGKIGSVRWMIPAVQTIHIICVAIVVSGSLFVSLRVLGIGDRSEALAALCRRIVPSIWYALAVQLLTGAVLIIGEPGRALLNPVFGLKMLMLAIVASLTAVLQRPLATEADYWDASGARRAVTRTIAVLSLLLWPCIVFAGRWIAYVDSL